MKATALLAGIAAAALAALLPSPAAVAAEGAATAPIAVVYPRVREPYRSAFLAIVEGVSAELGARAEIQEVEPEETAKDISARISARDAGTVLLLGKYGLEMSRAIDPALDRVVGAVLARPDELPAGARGISMVPAPAALFAKLRELAPEVRRITVVHGADDNAWLIEIAQRDAASAGYTLQAERRDTLRDGANAYRELLGKMEAPLDALWLPQASPFLNENSVLQMILRAAWDRNIVVFSSNVSHAKNGALFAQFPDNVEMGRALGRLAAAPAGASAGLEVLQQLDTAINIRTANHLGLGLNAADARFDMVFPSR